MVSVSRRSSLLSSLPTVSWFCTWWRCGVSGADKLLRCKMTSKLFAELCMFKNVANSLVMAAGVAATATLHLAKKEYNHSA